MDNIYLVGHEDVLRGGSMMQSAAEDMQRAANNIESALERHQRFLDEWLDRLDAALQAKRGSYDRE